VHSFSRRVHASKPLHLHSLARHTFRKRRRRPRRRRLRIGSRRVKRVPAPPGWSGRFWARTGCKFDPRATVVASRRLWRPNVLGGGAPPVTLVEFTIASGGRNDKDFYDVSLVDGWHWFLDVYDLWVDELRISTQQVQCRHGRTALRQRHGDCQYAGCIADLNGNCPQELQVMSSGAVVACKSACEAFDTPEFCCTGDHSTPGTCSPTQYSEMFKNACPTAYSYAYDDASSTCTCAGSDYLITFCPTGS
ncbi:hypothetical protein C3L33_11021, partial [Rhododendron williamsianum]